MENEIIIEGIFEKGYGIISKLVMIDDELSLSEKGLYAYLCSFSGKGKDCFPSRQKICRDLDISNESLGKYLKSLVENGYITIIQNKDNGKYSNNTYKINTQKTPCPKISNTGKIDTINNIYSNNNIYTSNSIYSNSINKDTSIYSNSNNFTNNKRIRSKYIVEQLDHIPYKSIVDYLNTRYGTSYKHTTSKTKDLIKARFNEGFTEEDFKIVIDKMGVEWMNTEMQKYLRPETLFGTKFESYLNREVKQKNAFVGIEAKIDDLI